jgi:hypothetical protein
MTFPEDIGDVKTGIGPGWHPIIERLMNDLMKLGWDGRVRQVKEKFGGLRFYVEPSTEALHDRIDMAAEESRRTCEACGKPGVSRGEGWIKTLCDEHANGRPLVDFESLWSVK